MDYNTPGSPVLHCLLEFAQIGVFESLSWSCYSTVLPSATLFSFVFNLSQLQGLFLSIGSFYQMAKVLEPQCQHQSFQLIFRVDFPYDWLVWTPCSLRDSQKSLLQHHNSKASILWHSIFLMVQISHPYMTTGKTMPLTRQTFVCKVMSLLFNMLCRLVIAFHPRSKRLLMSWLQSPSTVILEIRSLTVSIVSPSICHEVMDQMPWSYSAESRL